MKSSAVIFCVIALGGLGQAQKCTPDVAVSFEDVVNSVKDSGSSGTSGTGGTSDSSGIGGTSSSDISPLDLQVLENQNNLNEQLNDVIVQGGESIKDLARRALRSSPTLSKRADLVCSSDETCFSIEDDVGCGNLATGDVRGADGSRVNIYTGDYQLPDGEKGNLQTGPLPTEIASATLPASNAPASPKATTAARNTDKQENLASDATAATSAAAAGAAATDSPSSADASATSKAPALTSALSSILASRSASAASVSGSAAGSGSSSSSTPSAGGAATPGSGASALEFSSTAMMGLVAAASLLWRVFLA